MSAFTLDIRTAAAKLGGDVHGNYIMCPGPGHSAKDRSLRVWLDKSNDEGFTVQSYAGNDFASCRDYVRKRLGLPEWRGGDSAEEIIARMAERARRGPLDFNGAKPQHTPEPPQREKPTSYVYELADGTPYLRVDRYYVGAEKKFAAHHWTGTGWARRAPMGPKIPYRLPEMAAAVHDTVFIVEGEKDADRLAAAGFVATTNPHGAGAWTEDLNEHFVGKTVYILPDNDEPGAKHGRMVAGHLYGVASEVRIVNLLGLPEKGDVSDWLDLGNDPTGLIDLCKAAPAFDGREAASEGDDFHSKAERPKLVIGTAAELKGKTFPAMRYIVPGIIAEGCTLLAGRPKLGKSWLMLDVALAVSSGGACLGDIQCEQGDVLYLALEDNERRLQSRITKLFGAFRQSWPAALHYATECPRANDGGIEAIKCWISSVKNPRLVVVDVLAMFKPVRGSKESLYEADYAAIKGLQALASETGIAIVVVHHVRKSGSEVDPFEKVSGTLGLSGAADAVLILDRDGNGASLYGRGRDIEEIEKAVDFDKVGCRWRVVGEAQEVRRTDERATILAALDDATEPMTPSEIADVTRMSNTNVRQLLASMVKAGEVRKVKRGLYQHIDHKPPPDHIDHKITNIREYRAARDQPDADL